MTTTFVCCFQLLKWNVFGYFIRRNPSCNCVIYFSVLAFSFSLSCVGEDFVWPVICSQVPIFSQGSWVTFPPSNLALLPNRFLSAEMLCSQVVPECHGKVVGPRLLVYVLLPSGRHKRFPTSCSVTIPVNDILIYLYNTCLNVIF